MDVEEAKAKGIDNIFNEIIIENFPNLGKEDHSDAGGFQNTKWAK
jgi:hypothetical protein